MKPVYKKSPVVFDKSPLKTIVRDHRKIVLEYEAETAGPYLIDLTHIRRLNVQHDRLEEIRPYDMAIPQNPGRCRLQQGVLISRLNAVEAAIWLLQENNGALFHKTAFTDITDGSICLALIGQGVVLIVEHLTSMDLFNPLIKTPCFFQGPVARVPCGVVVLANENEKAGLLLSCAAGYAKEMVSTILAVGAPYFLSPAGESAFFHWFHNIDRERKP